MGSPPKAIIGYVPPKKFTPLALLSGLDITKAQDSISGDSIVHLAPYMQYLEKGINVSDFNNHSLQTEPVKDGYFWFVPYVSLSIDGAGAIDFGLWLMPTGFKAPEPNDEPFLDGLRRTLGIYLLDDIYTSSTINFVEVRPRVPIIVPQGWSLCFATYDTIPSSITQMKLKIGYVELPNSFVLNQSNPFISPPSTDGDIDRQKDKEAKEQESFLNRLKKFVENNLPFLIFLLIMIVLFLVLYRKDKKKERERT